MNFKRTIRNGLKAIGVSKYSVRGNEIRYGFKRFKFRSLGSNIQLGGPCSFFKANNISIGDNCFIGRDCYFEAVSSITIGDGTMIGPRVFCVSGSHLYDAKDLRSVPYDNRQVDLPIVIGNNVWVAGNVSIAPGTRIGEGSVIAMGCTVAGDIPPGSIVIGVKGQCVKQRDMLLYDKLVKENKIFLDVFDGSVFEKVAK